MMMSSGRDLILSHAGKRDIVPTNTPGVFVATFQAPVFAEWKRRQAKAWDSKKPADCSRLLSEADAYVLTMALVDESGAKLFTEKDFPELLRLPNGTFQSFLNAVVSVNGVAEITVENAEKNSDATSGDSSPTG